MWEFENKSIDAKNNVRKLKTFYVGDEAEKLAKYLKKNKILKPIVLDSYRTVRKPYIQASNYLQQNTLSKILCSNLWQGSIQTAAECLKLMKINITEIIFWTLH